MPQHFLRPRRVSSVSSQNTQQISDPDRSDQKARPVVTPRSAPLASESDECEEQSPRFTDYYSRTPIVDESGAALGLDFECSVSRGFFKIKEDWVCYRRNYISVMAVLKRHARDLYYVQLPHEEHLARIRHFAFVVAAVTAADPPRSVEMIQLSAKRDKGPQSSPEFVQISSPAFRAEWSRLQYKVATANNGKKRGQQYFAIKVTVLGWIEPAGSPGTWVELGDKYSEPMIVRGRSPGHYNDTDSSCNDAPPSPPVSPGSSESEPEVEPVCARAKGAPADSGASKKHLRPLRAAKQFDTASRPEMISNDDLLASDQAPFAQTTSIGFASRGRPSTDVSWTDSDHHLRLPPIQADCDCSNFRPRLPTYDELNSRPCYPPLQLPPIRLTGSPELQAALSLTAIRHLPSSTPQSVGAMVDQSSNVACPSSSDSAYISNRQKRHAEDDLSCDKVCTNSPTKSDTSRGSRKSIKSEESSS